MKDQLIEYETAKLLKSIIYNFPHRPFGYVTKYYHKNTGTLLSYGRTGKVKYNNLCYAPTQSLLQKWLREEHKIDISITYDHITYGCILYHECFSNGFQMINCGYLSDNSWLKTYEEVLERGLQEALKLIKDE